MDHVDLGPGGEAAQLGLKLTQAALSCFEDFGGPVHLYVQSLIDAAILEDCKRRGKPLHWALGGRVSSTGGRCAGDGHPERDWNNLCKLEVAVTTTPSDPALQGLVWPIDR